MACKTCRRQDVPDTCGTDGDEACPCCGMRVIARAETTTQDSDNEKRETTGSDSNRR